MKTVSGLEVRPTSDRLRETLFNILAPRVAESRFLDLCAGSGAIGLEALSRGAGLVVFVEKSRRSGLAIQENLALLGVTNCAQILQRDALAAIRELETGAGAGPFDLIFFDPPYASDLYGRLLPGLGLSSLVGEDTIVIVEHRSKLALAESYPGLRRYRQVRQGESALAFYAVEPASSPASL